MVIGSPRAFLSWSARMVIFLRVMCASCVCVAGLVGRARLADGHEKAPRRTEGQGKALKAPDALQEYAAVSVVTTIQATGF